MKINTIIFDFGGVLMVSAQAEAVRRFSELGIGSEVMALNKHTQTGLFGDLEEGKLTTEEFRSRLSQMVGRELTHEQLRWACLGYVAEVPQRNLRLLRQLRQEGYRLLLLSNTNPYMTSWLYSPDFDGNGGALTDYLDACYCSYELGLAKPDPATFRYVIEHEQLTPDATLFVDDNHLNIEAAQQLGLQTLQPENGEDWTGRLVERLRGSS